ncbi:MAG: bifunctional riboflavin kinase/FAD synthetase [Gemmatimonadales bacterium]|nr:bifunctional riboflavin kinase/FAD synthetase [Gemmatimonadales bacterium]PKL93864.1 MAG: bifunctional riboflavin kinase/FAD synthetase [Gemmatimonadetes bacterium HGW-Gemmatimonadetes-1]
MTLPLGIGSGSVVTVGTFDGVHLGHRAVLDEIARRAGAAGRMSVLVTFEPHPLAVVNPDAAPMRLTTSVERLELLADSAVDRVLVLQFDERMAAMTPAEFVDEVLCARCGMQELVIGHDHGFGRGRSGDVETLRALGATRGFPVDVVPAVTPEGGAPISSTLIRRAVAGGDLDGAARWLGRRYGVAAPVRRGDGRGRSLGFATLNLPLPPGKLLPPDGVWAVTVETPAGRFGGMMNQGHRPTIADGRRLLEVHLFGFEGDLYDRWVRVDWLARLRPIHRFDGMDALRRQLEVDNRHARAIVAAAHPDLDAPSTASE